MWGEEDGGWGCENLGGMRMCVGFIYIMYILYEC